ncbi:MAG: peptidoglycan-associated lipoprotein Pal [Gammaproteobacteria bacterium]|nr:peptidoglycan-associated lipoprotein Pal [Gammaproteobacteria bacterium]
MGKGFKYLLIAIFVVSLAGCKFSPVKKRVSDEDAAALAAEQQKQKEGETGAQDQRYGAEMGDSFVGRELEDPNGPLAKRVFYFGLDSSSLSADDREVIAAHAKYLSAHPKVTVVLEGHTDERGSREYNIALGERRARAVEQLLLVQGVSPSQVQLISFGEERPVALDHNEAAWRLNRRVEFLYSGY